MFTAIRALDMLNGMGTNGPVRFVRNAAADPSLFDRHSLAELAEGIELNNNKRPSAVALGALYAGYLAAKRGLPVQRALGYAYLSGSLADVVDAHDIEAALTSLVESDKASRAAAANAKLANGKAAATATKATLAKVEKVVDVITAGGVVSPDSIAQLEAAKARIEAALASVLIDA